MIDKDNVPSISLADKLGYRPFREGVYKGHPLIMFERIALIANAYALHLPVSPRLRLVKCATGIDGLAAIRP